MKARTISNCTTAAMEAHRPFRVTTPVHQINPRVMELYRKEGPLTAEEWAEWERITL